ncbi:Epoxide hydrolase [hydrothermal vent metagenome]|uniref:Epoxide hydrolase n=1 Tax=hydrothermal vent metagenome TaxID=652676 RepID=A0A3B0SDX7_9ZZZZ
MSFPPPTRIPTNGIKLSVHQAGPKDGVPVLLLHGWPELARSWQHQMAALADAGFWVIAPDLRGFGASDCPQEVEAYGIDILLADMTGLLDALDIKKAIWVGHDWGGFISWPAALLVPERVAGLVGVNTPHSPRAPEDPIALFRHFFGEDNYIVRFQELGLAEAAFTGRETDFFDFIFGKPPSKPKASTPPAATHFLKRFAKFTGADAATLVMPKSERKIYAATYALTGFTSGINYYRNLTANWQRMKGVDYTIHQPALMIGAELDLFLPPKFIDGMEERISDLETHIINGIGHWTQWEAPEELSRVMVNWLLRRFG